MIDPEFLLVVGTALGAVASGGAAWGGTRAALNGTKARVAKIEATLDAHTLKDETNLLAVAQRLTGVETKSERLVPIEAKLDQLLAR